MSFKYISLTLLAGGYFFTATYLAVAQSTLVDPSFNVGNGANNPVNTMLVLTNGQIMVGGDFSVIAGQTNLHLALLDSNGVPTPTFQGDTDGTVWHFAQQPDGKLLVAGGFDVLQGEECHRLGRLLTNGAVDSSFDAGTNFLDAIVVFTIALQPDGKILAGVMNPDYSSSLLRLNHDGSLDDSFINTNRFSAYIIHALLVQTNGNILVGGGFQNVNDVTCPGLAVLDSSGALVSNFVPLFRWYSDIFSFNESPDGKIIIGGVLNFSNAPATLYLARLNANFQRDTNFSTDIIAANSGQPTTFIASTALQPDGKIVAGGSFYEAGGYWRRQVLRFNTDGHIDTCFDPGLGALGFQWVQTVVLQSDGQILVGGRFPGFDETGGANFVRLLSGGDCNASRVHLRQFPESGYMIVAGTYPPGGTNYLQFSTNLLDWSDVQTTTGPYLFQANYLGDLPATPSGGYYRLKKTF